MTVHGDDDSVIAIEFANLVKTEPVAIESSVMNTRWVPEGQKYKIKDEEKLLDNDKNHCPQHVVLHDHFSAATVNFYFALV